MNTEAAVAVQYLEVSTEEAEEGTFNMGGMYKRQMSELITNHVAVDNIDEVLAKVERLGGKIIMPKMDTGAIGLDAVIQDTEGNTIGLLQAAKE